MMDDTSLAVRGGRGILAFVGQASCLPCRRFPSRAGGLAPLADRSAKHVFVVTQTFISRVGTATRCRKVNRRFTFSPVERPSRLGKRHNRDTKTGDSWHDFDRMKKRRINASKYRGQWLALDPLTHEVVGHDKDLAAAKETAMLRGIRRPLFYFVRESDAYFVGPLEVCR